MTIDGHVTIPASAGSLDQGPGRAVLAHELAHVRQQRALGAAMPAPGTESAHRLESAARTAEAAASWEVLTFARPGSRAIPDIDGAGHPGMSVSRSAGPLTPASVHAAMQMADGDAPPPAPDSASGLAGPSGGGAASAGAAATGGQAANLSDRDMDEMLRKLYPRLRRHLSSELLVARERAGVLADLR